jgi:sugar phosphate isomerase/epimerase
MTWQLSYCTLDRSPMFGLPETLEEQVRAAAAAGFTWITFDIFSLRAYRDARGGSVRALAAEVEACGLRTHDLNSVTLSDDVAASEAELEEHLRLADELGALWVQSRILEDTPALRERYAQAAARTAAAGFGFSFEHSPFSPITSLNGAAAFVTEMATAAPRQGLVIDTWHFFRCGDTYDDLRALDPALFAYAQFDDALPRSSDLRFDTLNRRALPGTGELPMREFLDVAGECGLGGVLSVELMSEGLRTLEAEPYAQAIARACAPFLA